jgi:hypothetical protein
MAKFDQRGQKVTNQINAESVGVVNFGAVQNKAELVAELRKLLSEVNKVTQAGIIKEEIAVDVESHIKKAVIEAGKLEPKKKSILDHLEGAKKLLDGITSATGLVTALMQAAKIVGGLFI